MIVYNTISVTLLWSPPWGQPYCELEITLLLPNQHQLQKSCAKTLVPSPVQNSCVLSIFPAIERRLSQKKGEGEGVGPAVRYKT